MKKLFFVAIAAFCGWATGANAQGKFVIDGQSAVVPDGTKIYLSKATDGTLSPLDSTVIKSGKFSFKGEQPMPELRYVSYKAGKYTSKVEFFLEEGNIHITLAERDHSVTGTQNNDRYQKVREAIYAAGQREREIYASLRDANLTDGQKEAKHAELVQAGKDMDTAIKEGMRTNISNPVGVMLLKQYHRKNTMAENEELLAQIPGTYKGDAVILQLVQNIKQQKNILPGKMYVDVELKDLQGKSVKLSDYIGKGKVVLIDFWASWCGPCRRSMPQMKELYAAYKDKGFEIIGVSLDSDQKAWENGVKQLGLPWPQMSDLKGWKCEAAQRYVVKSIPQTILINADGTIVGSKMSADFIKAKLDELLK